MYVCVPVSVDGTTGLQVSGRTKGSESPGNGDTRGWEKPDVDAGTWTWTLRRISKHPELLSPFLQPKQGTHFTQEILYQIV